MSLQVKLRLSLDAVIVLIFAISGYVSLEWQMTARIMPLTVSALGVVLGTANLIFDVVRWRRVGFAFVDVDRGKEEDLAQSREEATRLEAADIKRGMRYFAWIVAFSLVVWVSGAMIGASLFLLVFLRFEGGYSWRFTAISIIGVLVAIAVAEELLDLRLPRNFLGL